MRKTRPRFLPNRATRCAVVGSRSRAAEPRSSIGPPELAGVVKNSVRTRRVPVTFRHCSSLPRPSPSPWSPFPSPGRYSLGIRRAALRRVCMRDRFYATASRFSRVIVVDLHRLPGDGILGFLDVHHRRRCPGKPRRRSCPPKGAGALSEEEEEGEEEEEVEVVEEARHHHREGSRGRPAADTVNREWQTKAKCERAFLFTPLLCVLAVLRRERLSPSRGGGMTDAVRYGLN